VFTVIDGEFFKINDGKDRMSSRGSWREVE
jgi:hypothetical protein